MSAPIFVIIGSDPSDPDFVGEFAVTDGEAHIRRGWAPVPNATADEEMTKVREARACSDRMAAWLREFGKESAPSSGSKRVDELLAKCTEIENERRMWKQVARGVNVALDALILELAKERPLAAQRIRELADENERLLKDAWCRAASLAREFVTSADDALNSGVVVSAYQNLIREWRGRFAKALG